MATSSITKKFLYHVPISVTYLQGEDEILKFVERRKKTKA